MKLTHALLWMTLLFSSSYSFADDTDSKKSNDPLSTETFNGLTFRSIGPAVTSGRVVDFAVNPNDRSEYYVASASGGVWKTINAGTTWEPVFDNEGSYSIGCVRWTRITHRWSGSAQVRTTVSAASRMETVSIVLKMAERVGKTWA